MSRGEGGVKGTDEQYRVRVRVERGVDGTDEQYRIGG